MNFGIPDTTFKQELLNAIEEHKQRELHIDDKMKFIKERIKENFLVKSFMVCLVHNRSGRQMAIGSCSGNYSEFFVPKCMEPERYRDLYVDEFKKLGFTDRDIELSADYNDDYDTYYIRVTW